jgi:hypothetical protein
MSSLLFSPQVGGLTSARSLELWLPAL